MSYQTRHADNPPDVAQGAFPDEVLLTLVDVFFDSIYPMPSYSFLHPQTTKRLCLNGRVRNELISAVCAITALYLGGGHGVTVGTDTASAWIQAAEQSIWQHLECPTIPRLQTLMLVIHYHMETSRFQRAFMLMATAARFAAAMSLNHERPDLDPVAREVRRRILWSLKIIERYFSSGLAEFDLLPLEVIYIDFPHSEKAFTSGSQGGDEQARQGIYGDSDHSSSGMKRDDEEGGAYRLLVQLESVRRDIMKLTRSIALVDKELPSLSDLIRHHEQTLTAVEPPATLPGGGDTPASAEEKATTDPDQDPWLSRRVLAHVSWHQTHCDLYRILLPGYPEAAPAPALKGVSDIALAAAEQQCLHHAMGILQIITALNQNSTRQHLLEFDTAICAYHASRLVLFISHFGKGVDRPTPEYAASRVDLCLAALKRFFPSSALVAPIIQELGQSLKVFTEQEMNRHHNPQPCRVRPPGNLQTPSPYETSTLAGAPPSSPGEQVHDPRQQHHQERQQQQDEGEGHACMEKLSAAARTHQRLAIHSLLRRADFDGDDEGEEEMAAGRSMSLSTTEPPLPPDELQHQQQWQSRDGPAGARSMPPEERPILTDPAVPLATSSHSDVQVVQGHSDFNLGSMHELDLTGSPSPVSFQDMDFAPWLTEETQPSFFAWRGPRDWDWLLTPRETPSLP
ncbi:uncharacterized protein DNG_00357 [Cephalotrichum gorgonifer]|uniref:Xylanolytic transcriptional activator regulatory domain-containing protein n=1 Tax=Cephalotrichum gorgonifer TaxID=2041049 RepID=A0AAE8MP40_9PEZI|nr:uncharacterized protein DNG_00357 [Cephalotrichum gorgonifer]